jgi:hypothetical protein
MCASAQKPSCFNSKRKSGLAKGCRTKVNCAVCIWGGLKAISTVSARIVLSGAHKWSWVHRILFEELSRLSVDRDALVRDRLAGISLTDVAKKYRISRASVVRVVWHAKQSQLVAA